jgi:hypothetical protein
MLDSRDMLMQRGHPPLGFAVIFAGVDVEERGRAPEVLEVLFRQHSDPHAPHQFLYRFVAGHEEGLDVGDAVLGVDRAQGLVGPGDARDGHVKALAGGKHPFQDVSDQEREIDSQNEAPLEAAVPETGENSAQRTRLAYLVRMDGDVEEGKDLGRTYDKRFLNVGLEQADSPVDQAAAPQGKKRLVAAHAPAPPAGEDKTAEPLAGFHRLVLPLINGLIVVL